MSITREEIAALEIVADPKASFRHKLPTGNISIKWILKRRDRQLSSHRRDRSEDSPASAGHERTSHLHADKNRAPEEVDGVDSTKAMVVVSPMTAIAARRRKDGEVAGQDSAEGAAEGIQAYRGGESPTRLSNVASTSTGGGSQSRVARFDAGFLDPPDPLLTIRDIPAETTVTDKTAVLLNSPRSALIVLRQGFAVADLCMVDPNDFYVKGSLEGVTRETVEMRIAAENKRRNIRFKKCLNEYIKLCHTITFNDLVRAIREHKYGEDKQRAENKALLAEVPLFAHGGKQDLTVLDPDHVQVLMLVRERTVRDIRRQLELAEKNLDLFVAKEQAVMAKDVPLEKLRQQQEEAAQQVRERNLELKKRSQMFRQRVERVSKEQEAHIQERRERMEQRHHEQEDQQERRRAEKLAAAEEKRRLKAQRLHAVKQQMEQAEEERRLSMMEKAELTAKLQARERQRTKEIMEAQAAECKRISDERLDVIRRLGEIETEERRQRAESVLEKSSTRLRDFAELKQMRIEQKKHLSLDKELRREAAKRNADGARLRRLRELEENFKRQQETIAEAELEHRQRMELKSEMARQTRIKQLEEKERCMSALEFRYIGYQGNSYTKTRWLDMEAEKKQVLTSHARQEREALFRAKNIVLAKIEEQEILRRKKESYRLTKCGPSSIGFRGGASPRPSESGRLTASSQALQAQPPLQILAADTEPNVGEEETAKKQPSEE
jgi:hypothetical protein